jgi:hypothetical protein
MYKSHDFICRDCSIHFDALIENGEKTTECVDCGAVADIVLSAPNLGFTNDPARQTEMLKKRSEAHSLKQARSDPEGLAAKMGAKPAVQSPWNLRKKSK